MSASKATREYFGVTLGLLGLAASVAMVTATMRAEPESTQEAIACDFPPAWVTASVYRVTDQGRTGGSAVLTSRGWYTAAHVLSMGSDLEVHPEEILETFDGKPANGGRITNTLVSPGSDAGVFNASVEGISLGALQWRLDAPVRGERVWAIGYPLGRELTVTTGHVNGIEKEKGWLYHSASAMSGMSGGAVVSCHEQRGWELVGVTAAIAAAPQRTPMGYIRNVVPFMSYATTYKQHMDNIETHKWGETPW